MFFQDHILSCPQVLFNCPAYKEAVLQTEVMKGSKGSIKLSMVCYIVVIPLKLVIKPKKIAV